MKTYYYREDEMYYDAVERDYPDVFAKIDAEVEEALKDSPIREGQMGYCYTFWDKKQEILKQKYKIDWHTPAETNPDTLFD
jgi:hypothetical protein